MNLIWSLLSIALLAGVGWSAESPTSTNSHLTQGDINKMKKILDVAYKFNDLSAAYHQAVGYQHLGESLTRSAEICKLLIEEGNKPGISLESIFYVSGAWKIVKTCQPASLNTATLIKQLNSVLEKESVTVLEIYYAVSSLVAFGHKIPEATITKVVKNIQTTLKKDDSILNLAHTFHIAAEFGASGSFAFKHIEEAIVQADEVDSRFLQFEGGLSVTSHVVNGIYKLSAALKKKPEIKPIQVAKFANYFLSRRSVQTPKGAANFLSSIHVLANNPYDKPVCITLAEDGLIISAQQPLVKVKVCNILGKQLQTVPSVMADSATKMGDDVVVLRKKAFQANPKDKSLYTLNFLESKPEPGFYKIVVSAAGVQSTIESKVLTDVKVENLEIGTADADQTTPPKLSKLTYPNQRTTKIEADSQQKVVLRFLLKDSIRDKPMRVHQAFVRLSSISKDKREIIFVAEPDSSHLYKFDMVVGTAAKTFNYLSGEYDIELIIGDSILGNSMQWKLGNVVLKFPEPSSTDVAEKSSVLKQPQNIYLAKPEIRHMFREPEKRPPAFVSNLFTGLCLASNLLLIILWAKLDVNFSNFPLTLSAIGFHLGLGSIFVLYFVFWWKLDMFTTLRYLFILGLITFLSGNKLLSYIARNRKSVPR